MKINSHYLAAEQIGMVYFCRTGFKPGQYIAIGSDGRYNFSVSMVELLGRLRRKQS